MEAQHAAAAVHERVAQALRQLVADRSSTAAPPSTSIDLLTALTVSVLRRLDADELTTIDPQATAAWVAWLAPQLQQCVANRAPQVTISAADQSLDGKPAHGSSIDVITDDRPFLLSTISDELHQHDLGIARRWHPIIGIQTTDDGALASVVPARAASRRISVVHLELDQHLDADAKQRLARRLEVLITDVTRATDDFEAMRARIGELSTELRFGAWTDTSWQPDHDRRTVDVQEAADLLDWINDDNLVLLGVRDYEGDDRDHLTPITERGLGLLRRDEREPSPVEIADRQAPSPGEMMTIGADALLSIARTTARSTVQRRDHLLQVRLLHREDDRWKEVRVVGLFTRKGLADPVRTTPVVRRKLRAILEREDVVDASHDEGTFTALFQALPKDELFILALDDLHTTIIELFHAEERGHVHTVAHLQSGAPTASLLVSVPRDRYGPQLRHRIEALLTERFAPSRIDVDLSLGQHREALVRFLLHVGTSMPVVDLAQLRSDIALLARSWIDDVTDALQARRDVTDLQMQLAHQLPSGYRDTVDVATALADVDILASLLVSHAPMTIRVDIDPHGTAHHLLVARRGAPLELSAFLPILESLGMTVIQEIPHRLERDDDVYLQDFTVATGHLAVADQDRLAAAILAAWRGHLETDPLNALILTAELEWRQVMLLRALRRLRRQVGTTFTPDYMNEVIASQPTTSRALVDYFEARFDPDRSDDDSAAARSQALEHLDALPRLDQDRVLRGLLELIDATVRTNAFRDDAFADETGEPYLAFKVDSSKIAGVALPVPYRETFVSAPGVEGIHLRFGPVARGGLRWSDRRDDVRTEVFDLVKAQLLKNAVIVPTGAKGGFVVAHEPEEPGELRDEVRRQYVTFVRGLLDIADNLDGDEVVTPPRVRCHDGPDPYLVVAADRGTATLSDTANDLADRYGFWLNDGFASGGSQGYDHKALGVTAKGAWRAVRRHFRELGIDVQTEPITVAGVGDMSGDVFGNGMLQSEAIKLVAAFDHRDIFIDPDPDIAAASAERRRLFGLPRSSWQDYDRTLLSPGGGVFSRSARSIDLSDEIRTLLRIDQEHASPIELIRAILCAPVDLLFAGGIGTYVKASSEDHLAVGDRANDELRVDGRDVRARVIGEGANLFITQRGRIEYARRGGHLNQDAIDNAGGVATSDVEVNLKILLKAAIDHGELDPAERNDLLASMADEAVELVMGTVERQAAAISRERRRSVELLDAYDRMMTRLTATHALDREVERLPDADEIHDRAAAGAGLTRPELATLLAWAKRDLKDHLLAGALIDGDLFDAMMPLLLPATATRRFAKVLGHHRLRREMTATATANEIVDRMGVSFIRDFADTMTVDLDDAVLAYQVARDALGADSWWNALDEFEQTNDPERIDELTQELEHLVTGVATGVVRHPALTTHTRQLSTRIGAVIQQLTASAFDVGTDDQRLARTTYVRWLVDDLIDPDLAKFLSLARDLTFAPEIADVVEELQGKRDAVEVADAFLRLGAALHFERIENKLARVTTPDAWATRQRDGIRSDLRRARRDATRLTLQADDHLDVATAVAQKIAEWQAPIAATLDLIDGIDSEKVSLDALAVCTRAVHQVVERG